jgi:uracil-DNA glycosylase
VGGRARPDHDGKWGTVDDDWGMLRLQMEWGADEALALEPVDRLRAPAVAETRSRLAAPVVRPVAPIAPPVGTPGERALAAAQGASNLEELRAAIAAFDGCHLRQTASHLVFAEGNPESSLLLIGDPPGREEDRSGHPFAGAEGQLLDQMLASVGLTRDQVMATPLIPWRPPGERPVNASELAMLMPFLHRLIGLLQPERVVIFGAVASRALLGQALPRNRKTIDWSDLRIANMQKTIDSIAVPSLGAMLKTPPLRRDAWMALRRVRRALDA